jgi:hypothetical protein
MKEDDRDKCLRLIIQEITLAVERSRFYQCDKNMWIRKWGWKSDLVILYKKSSEILINLCVWIPPEVKSGFDFDHEEIDMINLGTYVGLGKASHDFPGFFGSMANFRRKVIEDLEKGMKWFDNYATPKLCLEYMQKQSYDTEAQGPLYRMKYLKSLPVEINGQYDCQVKYPNEYSRALFDLNYKGQLPEIEGGEEDDDG